MKKINLLFVLFFVFAVNAVAQKKNKKTEAVDIEYLNSIVVVQSPEKESLGLSASSVPAPLTGKAILQAREEAIKKGLIEEKPFVSKSADDVKKANPNVYPKIVGSPADLSNQPLKKYNEDLVPIKVN